MAKVIEMHGFGFRAQAGLTVHKWEKGAHYPIYVPVCTKRVREQNWGVRNKWGDAKGVAKWGSLCKGGE